MKKLDNLSEKIEFFINKNNAEKKDVFKFIQKSIEEELEEKDETLFIYRFQFWSDYKVNKGIRVNSTISEECKVALMIHEYNHFLEAKSSSYFPFEKEKIDKDVSEMIKKISIAFNKNTKERLFTEEIKKDEIYRKMFISA